MMTATIRIELSGLDKARKEVEALLVYIDELEKDYPVAKKEEVKPKTTRKPRATKPKTPVKAKEETKEVAEPTPTPETTQKGSDVTEADILALARETGERLGDKAPVKEVIGKYGAKISSVKPEDYEALANDLKAL